MSAFAATVSARPSMSVPAAGVAGGVAVGAIVAWNPLAGLAILFALIYAPLAMYNLPLAVGLWMPLIFLEGLPGATMLPEAGAAVIVASWTGQALRPGSWQRQQLQRHKRVLTLAGAFVLWLAVSLTWAQDPGRGMSVIVSATEVLLLLAVVSTIPSSSSHLRILAAGFVAGALLSALIGIVGQAGGAASVVEPEGRLQGAAGDPNFFAAQMVAAMALAIGLIASSRSAGTKLLLGAALVPIAYGVIASQSRGGFVALIAAGIGAIVIFRRQRVQIMLVVAGIAAVMGIWLTSNQAAWNRITNAGQDRGSGREDLWTIALRVYDSHPALGVGVNNFAVYAPQYTREPGTLTGVKHVETDLQVHNAYLSLLTETGMLGVALFISLAGTAVVISVRGGRRFELAGDDRAALLARATAVALTAMLSAAFFLSDADDKRIWVLMAMCVASGAIARQAAASAARPPRMASSRPVSRGRIAAPAAPR